MANAYFYTPKYRPPDFGNVPAGWTLVERGRYFDPPARRDVPLGQEDFGVLCYRRPLSAEELERWELTPVN